MKGLTVTLSHAPNPDIGELGGYWDPPVDPPEPMHAVVYSLAAAKQAVQNYIDRNGLGGGNWTGGQLMLDGKPIGRISYNGRAWHLGAHGEKELWHSDPVLGCYAAGAAKVKS